MKRFIHSASLVVLMTTLASIPVTASAQPRLDRNYQRDERRSTIRTETVTCESRDGRRHHCEAATLGQITLTRQLSRRSNCVENRTWGSDAKGIWVDRGCRAEFLVTGDNANDRDRRDRQSRALVCESRDGERTYCRGNAAFGVELTHQLSRNECVRNRTWGSDQNGVWVSNGCRAEFTLNSSRRN